MSKSTYKRTSRFYTHRFLWKTSQTLINQIKNTKNNPMHFEYTSYLIIYFTLESYLNYLGESLYPKVWANEKSYFSSEDYKGTIGKIKWLAEKLEVPKIYDTSIRPGQTISNLKKIRNLLVHGSVDINETVEEIDFSELNINIFLKTSLEKRTHDDFLDHSINDVKKIIEDLHEKALVIAKNEIGIRLEPNALQGSYQVESGGTVN